jgi:hypothetical protein
MMNRLDEPQNITRSLYETFDSFDEVEPMCSGARGLFRNEIVPQAKQLLQHLLDKGDLDAARALDGLFDTIKYFVAVNGPAWVRDNPDDGLLQRADLEEDEQRWRP